MTLMAGQKCPACQKPILPERSYKRIEDADLERLGRLAQADRQEFFARNPRWRHYADRIVCVALCQGAALHFLDGKNGGLL